MKNGIKFIMGKGLKDALQIQDLDEAKEYLKDFANILNGSSNPIQSAFINILDEIRGKCIVELDSNKYKVWLDAYCKIRQEEQKEEIKNSTITESRLIKQTRDDLLDLILNNDLESNEREIMNKAYFLKELINLIKKEATQCSDSVMK